LIGNVVARAGGPIDEVRSDAVQIGARVRAVFEPIDEAVSLPRWLLA